MVPNTTTRPTGLLTRPLVVVTGKGGVGKTTVATAVGLAAARRGLRVVVAEVSGRDDVARTLGNGPSVTPEAELAPGLHHLSIDPQAALEEYVVDQLPSRTLAGALLSASAFTTLTAAAPGLRELVTMGKVWELAQPDRRSEDARPYDLVVLDAPATGHGVAFLTAPRTFAAIAQAGRIARHAATIDAMLSDPARTAVIAVARAEELPVNETLALERALDERVGLALDLVVVNAVLPDRFDDADARALAAAPASAAVVDARVAHARALAQREQLTRLRDGTRAPVTTLPQRFTAALGPDDLDALTAALEPAL